MRRTILLAGVVAAGLAVLTACGQQSAGSPAGFDPNAPVTNVAQLAQFVSLHTSDVSAHVSMVIVGGATGRVTGVINHGASAADLTYSVYEGPTVEFRLINGKTYMSVPPSMRSAALVTSPWAEITPDYPGSILEMLPGPRIADLAQALDLIKPAATIISTADLPLDNGVLATHYAITVDLTKLVTSPALTPVQVQQYANVISHGATTEDWEVWIGSDRRPVKTTARLVMPDPKNPRFHVGEDVTTNYSDWGPPVTITAPPADQVTPLSHG